MKGSDFRSSPTKAASHDSGDGGRRILGYSSMVYSVSPEGRTPRISIRTKTGTTSAAESITESLRRTRQLMVQEVERSAMTLATFEESTGFLKKAEGEYKGQRSLLMHTRRLLTTMQRPDVMDRVIMVIGFVLFLSAVLYVVSKRIGLLALLRKILAAIKAGSLSHEDAAANGQSGSLRKILAAIKELTQELIKR